MKLTFTEFPPLTGGPARGPFVKLVSEDANARPRRVRVRILDEETNKLVAYPSGRVRWFGSEDAADEWIRSQSKPKTRNARPRNYSERP
jgi:hypothetical protein